MACCLVEDKPSYEPMLEHGLLEPKEQTIVKS